MFKTRILSVVRLFLIGVAALGGCLAHAEELVIPGSGNPEYVLGQMAKVFNARQSMHRVVVPPSSGHAGAVRDVSEGVSPLGRVGRPLSESEAAKGLTYLPLGRDAITVVAGASVTVRGISTDQLLSIFSGKITDWSELGGKRAPIRAIGKENSDAIRRQLSLRYANMHYGDSVKIVHLDTYLIELLDRYPTSISIMNRSALSACKTKVVMLALDGVEPSVENVANGTYPLVMEYGLVYKSTGLSPAAKAFIEFIRSSEGASLLRSYGVLVKSSAN